MTFPIVVGSTRHGEATIRSRGSPYRRAPLEYLDIAIRSRRKHRHIQRMPKNRRVSVVREAERSIAHRHQHHHQLEGIVSFLSQLSDPTTNSLTMSNSCKRDLEVDRYEHFVAAANESLKMLKPLWSKAEERILSWTYSSIATILRRFTAAATMVP